MENRDQRLQTQDRRQMTEVGKKENRRSGEQEIRITEEGSPRQKSHRRTPRDELKGIDENRRLKLVPSTWLRAGSFGYPFDFPFDCAQGFGLFRATANSGQTPSTMFRADPR